MTDILKWNLSLKIRTKANKEKILKWLAEQDVFTYSFDSTYDNEENRSFFNISIECRWSENLQQITDFLTQNYLEMEE